MRYLVLVVLLFAGCSSTTKTTISIYFQKDLWIENDPEGKPDGLARFEYKIDQPGPWTFRHE